MVKRTPIKQGHLYWVDCEPHAGHEEGSHNIYTGNIRRPVVVVSNN
ncbi:type II toxin-antitoxin system PemK/MazF family toxin [Levilactobacillus koreensis]